MGSSATKPTDRDLREQLRDMNAELLVSSVRQHELTEAAEHDADKLRAKQTELTASRSLLRMELTATERLQEISTQLIGEDDPATLYEKILDAAIEITEAQFASIQQLQPERGSGGELWLLGYRGFSPESAKFWEWVTPTSDSTCGIAMRTGGRVIVNNVEADEQMAGTEDLANYIQTGIRAVQTTPLISRGGQMLGMLSTHWSMPHTPAEHDLRLLDVLARQAADLMERKQTRDQLVASERRFRAMIDGLPAAIYTTDAEGRITHFNPASVDFAGREPRIGSDEWCVSWKLYHPDGSPMPHDQGPMAVTLREGRAVRGEEAMIERPDGTRRWFEPYPTPLFDSEGKVTGGINMLVDITERKHAEESRATLAAIVEWSDDAIISKDLNGIIKSWNLGAEKIFGFTAEEAVGQPVTILMPAERLDEEPYILDRIRHGETVDHYETVRRRKDGSDIDISLTVSPIRDKTGKIVAASKVARDVSDRRRAEENILRTQKTFFDLVENAPFGIYVVDSGFRISMMNLGSQTEAFRNVEDVIGRDFSEAVRILWSEPVASEVCARFRHTLDTGEPYYSDDFRNVRDDVDRIESYEWSLQRIVLPDGQFGVVCYFYDSTRLRDAEEALKEYQAGLEALVVMRTAELNKANDKVAEENERRLETEKEHGRLLSQVITTQEDERRRIARDLHDELGQQLTALRLKLESMRKMCEGETVSSEIEGIQLLAARLDQEVSFLARELRPAALDGTNLVDALSAYIKEWSRMSAIAAEFHADGFSDRRLDTDLESNLYRIAQEALNNARKHSKAGRVSVLLKNRKNEITLIVEDDGIGFDPDARRSRKLGIGLIGMRERVALLRGTIEIESVADTGTTIFARIPNKKRRANRSRP